MVFSVIMEGIVPGSGVFRLLGEKNPRPPPKKNCSFRLKSRNPVRRIFLGKERWGKKGRDDAVKANWTVLTQSLRFFGPGGSVQVWR